MSGTTIIQGQSTFTGTFQKLLRDPILNTGSKLLLDFANTYFGNPNPAGSIAVGGVFNDFVSANPVAVLGAATITSNAGSAGLSVAGGSTVGYINIGSTGSYTPTGTNDLLAIMWIKLPPTAFVTTGLVSLFGFGSSSYFNLYESPLGTSQAWVFVGPSGNITITVNAGSLLLGTIVQLALHLSPSTGLYEYYINGVKAGGTTVATWAYGNSSQLRIGAPSLNGFQGNFYRSYIEDVTVSAAASGLSTTAQALSQVVADYKNLSRFS